MFYLGGGTLHIIDGTFNGYYNIVNCYADGELALGGTVVIDSGTFITTEDDGWNTTIMGYENSNITINGGKFTMNAANGEYAFYIGTGSLNVGVSADSAVATINGGEFNGPVAAENGAELTIKGGAFSEDPSAYLAEGYSVVGNSGNYTVADPAARIGDTNFATLASAVAAATAGDTVTVLKDLNQPGQVTINKSITLDLNGKTLSNTADIWGDSTWSLISAQGNIEVTITGTGTLNAKPDDEYAVDLRDGAKVTIENGTYNGNISAVYVHDGELTINGGTFRIQQLDNSKPYAFTLNCLDANYINGTCKISVKGGTFNNFDPAANAAESSDNSTNFVVEGYKSTAEGDNYTVSAIDYTVTISDSISNGTVTASKTTANVGDEITLTATPASNYVFGSWSVKEVDDNTITVTNNKFTMPAKNVTVSATFNKKSSGGSPSSSSSSTSSNNTGTNNSGATIESGTTADTGVDTSTVNPQTVQANGYTNEMNEAYKFAYANGITTMKTIDDAEMFDGLTRIAMAKMLSQYAINVLGKTPADVEVPNFVDVTSDLDAEYDNGVTLAYKLGIMGINMPDNKFLPYETVTRAQFGTALSRLLFCIEDGEDAYYTTHLAKLKEAGIITNDDPTLEELRGYVMLMLMRSSKGSNTVNNSTEGTVSNEDTNKPENETNVQEQEVEKYFTEAYRRGQIYGRIGDLQRLLQYLGYYNGEINNTFDNNTINAVFDFQIAMGILAADDKSTSRGNVGPKTREVLNQKWAEFKASK